MISKLLGLERRMSPENPAFNLQDPSHWDSLGGGSDTAAGVKMSHRGMLNHAAVWMAVNLISGTIARLPLNVYRRRPDLNSPNAREVDRAHPAQQLVRWRANHESSSQHVWRVLMSQCLLWNNAYAYIDQETQGMPRGIFPLLPDRTKAERINGRDLYNQGTDKKLANSLDGQLVYVTETGGNLRTFFPSQILHLRGVSIDGIEGCDLLAHAKDSIALGLAHEKFAAKFFSQGARAGGILEVPSTFSRGAKDNLQEGFEKAYGGENNWFKTIILREGAKFHRLTMSPKEGQSVEATESQVRQAARWFKMPPSKLGLSDSVSYNSKAEDNQAYHDDTLADWLYMIASECRMKLLAEEQQQEGTHYLEHNTSALLAMNPQSRHEVYERGIRMGMYSPNECRAKENMNPREGGDTYVDPQLMQGAPASNRPDSEEEPDKETDEKDGKKEEKNAGARLTFAAKARHKAKNPRAFVEWIDNAASSSETREVLGELRDTLETTTEEDLFSAVDKIVTRYAKG